MASGTSGIPNTSGASFAPSTQTTGLEIDPAQKGTTGEGINADAQYYSPAIDRAAQYSPMTEPVRGQAESGLVDGVGAWVASNLPTSPLPGVSGARTEAGSWPIGSQIHKSFPGAGS